MTERGTPDYATSPTRPRGIVLVGNPDSGHGRHTLHHVQELIEREGLELHETVSMADLGALTRWVQPRDASGAANGAGSGDGNGLGHDAPLIVAAGGDGTVGAVADYVANTRSTMGIVPLGTSNDVARSLDIPMKLPAAVRLLGRGQVATVDVGKFITDDGKTRHFVHAAAVGIDVAFAKMATQTSLRKRLGRLTYLVAAVRALWEKEPFDCTLEIEGRSVTLRLIHLSVVNAPIFGGRFSLTLPGSSVADRRLDILTIDDVPLPQIAFSALPILFHRRPHIGGIRLYHVREMHVHTARPLDVSLDGEVMGRIPGDFVMASDALRVVAGPRFTP